MSLLGEDPSAMVLPPLIEARSARAPRAAAATLPNGLDTMVVRRPTVPMVEVRLHIPLPMANSRTAAAAIARGSLMSSSMLFGTAQRDQRQLANDLAAVGADLAVSADADRLLFSTAVLRTGLSTVLDLLAEILTSASYPSAEVVAERDRLGQRIAMALTQPGVVARMARSRRLFGDHPYAHTMPDPSMVAELDAGTLRRSHRDRARPYGATLVVVGDVQPATVAKQASSAFADWVGPARGSRVLTLPDFEPGGITLVDRPGAVQSNIRIGGAAVGRRDPAYAALKLANLIFGGYFSSRLTENLRERNGFTYSPHSGVDNAAAGSTFIVDADVATEVTARAVHETWYELGRMALAPVTQDELDLARRYALGTLALSTATQAGLASTLTSLVGQGLSASWLADHQKAVAGVTIADVQEAARRYFAVSSLATVVVGDATVVEDSLRSLAVIRNPE
ncbi:MAG: insulinase family protein [Geodermatophilaceae bacterium]|nr:insulinase family protein [Geodermatophilaceae bacterium]